MVEKEITLKELVDVLEMDINSSECYDISGMGLEVESINHNNTPIFKEVNEVLVKPKVDKYYELNGLKGTENHKVLHDGNFIKLKNHPNAKLINEDMNVVDISVADTECYIANGQINHNTTSGGFA